MNDKQPNKNTFRANGLPTLIGSLPITDYQQAVEWIFAATAELPLWPQLPAAGRRERMLNQFIEGLPGIVETEDKTFFNTGAENFAEEQLRFYEDYLLVTEDPSALHGSRFMISRERARGLYKLVEMAAGKKGLAAVKGQITGPFTQLTGIVDQNDRLGYYDPAIRDIVVKGIAWRAAWQVGFLRDRLSLPVLMFIDEPALAGLGSSAFISISREDIAQDLAEVIDAIHQAGGLAGVHVCANTDWTLLLSSAVDIISFDAHGFFDRFITCRQQIHSFLERNGIIAWGLVPTSEEKKIRAETPESLAALWVRQAGQLVDRQWDLAALLSQTLITPSCGTGSLSVELARRVLSLTRELSVLLRQKHLPAA